MKLKTIQDEYLLGHFDAIGQDGTDLFLMGRGRFRTVILTATRLVNQMRANHELGILESLILGHAYMASVLMATSLKGKERIAIDVTCDGPVGGLHAEATASGAVRGYLSQANIPIDAPVESFDTAPWFGTGMLSVTRRLDGEMRPYTGRIELVHGNLAQDLTRYYAISEQTPTALALSVKFNREGIVVGAGGLLVQSLPAGNDGEEPYAADQEAAAARIEELVQSLPSLGSRFAKGSSAAELVREHFAALDPIFIGTRPVEFYCDCNRERFRRFIAALPPDDLEDVRENGPFPLKVTCHNCSSDYFFDESEIDALVP